MGFGSEMNFKFSLRSVFRLRFWGELFCEFRYGWQRLRYGYSDAAVWSIIDFLKRMIVRLLLDLADNHMSAPNYDNLKELPIDEVLRYRLWCDGRWTETLVDVANEFRESLEFLDSNNEKNEYATKFFSSLNIMVQENKEKPEEIELITIPKEGYSQEQVEYFGTKWAEREQEISKYKKEKEKSAFIKLLDIYDYLAEQR